MRSATERAASLRGWVCPIMPATPRPSCMQIFGSCVVLPEPVSPDTMTTWWSRMARAISSRRALTGRSGKEITGIAAARSASRSGVKGLKGRACSRWGRLRPAFRGRGLRALGVVERESGMIAPV